MKKVIYVEFNKHWTNIFFTSKRLGESWISKWAELSVENL